MFLKLMSILLKDSFIALYRAALSGARLARPFSYKSLYRECQITPRHSFRVVCWTRPPMYEIPFHENFCWTGQTAGRGSNLALGFSRADFLVDTARHALARHVIYVPCRRADSACAASETAH